MAEQDKDPFYVGYLPLPPAIRRFILPWLVGNLVLAVGIAAVVAQPHRPPGDGGWDISEAVVIHGWLQNEPYPILKTQGKTFILVEQGKFGVTKRISDLGIESGWIKAEGFVIQREGRHVLEIDSSSDHPITSTEHDLAAGGIHDDVFDPEAPMADLGTHTLRGEIVDPKCYLGVMQPGDGKTHKACATLCLKGGIPPMFLVRDRQGRTAAYLLTDAEGKAIPESVHPYIADPIELTGRVLREGDLLVLRADFGSIKRLD